MAIVINGSGTVTGISVGGLPDGVVDLGTLAADAVDGTKLADDAVNSEHLVDAGVDAVHLADVNAWTDYGGTSTITGWSSFTASRKHILYLTLGKILFVFFHLEGTSNATTVRFTLPAGTLDTSYAGMRSMSAWCYNNGSSDSGSGMIDISENSTQVDILRNGGSAWTASGTKIASGSFVVPLN